MNTKQVIVMRKDLNMRKGKMCAQASHASMSFLTKEMRPVWYNNGEKACFRTPIVVAEEINHWLNNSFRKICVYVNSEEELIDIHRRALEAGLMSHLIEDNGTTEFNGVKTKTAVAIGPHWNDKFIDITNNLRLY